MTGDRPEDRWREWSPQVLGALVRRFGDLDAAEDALQEALVTASSSWTDDGVADDPVAWLVTVALAPADRPVAQRSGQSGPRTGGVVRL